MREATSPLLLLFLLDANRAVGGDFIDEVRSCDHLGKVRILLEDVQDVGVLRSITQYMGVISAGFLGVRRNRAGFDNRFVQLAFFENFLAAGGNEIANIAAERIDTSLQLSRIKIDVQLAVGCRKNSGVVRARGLPKFGQSDFECASGIEIEARVFLWRVVASNAERLRLVARGGFVSDQEFRFVGTEKAKNDGPSLVFKTRKIALAWNVLGLAVCTASVACQTAWS